MKKKKLSAGSVDCVRIGTGFLAGWAGKPGWNWKRVVQRKAPPCARCHRPAISGFLGSVAFLAVELSKMRQAGALFLAPRALIPERTSIRVPEFPTTHIDPQTNHFVHLASNPLVAADPSTEFTPVQCRSLPYSNPPLSNVPERGPPSNPSSEHRQTCPASYDFHPPISAHLGPASPSRLTPPRNPHPFPSPSADSRTTRTNPAATTPPFAVNQPLSVLFVICPLRHRHRSIATDRPLTSSPIDCLAGSWPPRSPVLRRAVHGTDFDELSIRP
ncbi:hypothetical protein CCHR01_04658 [Colletotrichum chrysophilum]|uniref:Uncharacterized protein n=1 Tax=Colletotrichum chrysophilum TaxID=1836956 RepID=A0AAD9AT40_9PEZI|nr:hypothetical protein CCHR01_04658 [Colletotrichum chrysophilum]